MAMHIFPRVTATGGSAQKVASTAQGYWLEQTRRDQPESRIPLWLELRGRLNVLALELALIDTVTIHDALRVRYVREGSAYSVEFVDAESMNLKHGTREVREASDVWRQLHEEYVAPPTRDRRPLSLTLFRIASDHHVLGGFVDHASFDRTSDRIFWTTLVLAYRSRCLGLQLQLPPSYRYEDFCGWEASWLTDQQRVDADLFWSDHLGLESGEPAQMPTYSAATSPCARTPFRIEGALFERVRMAAHRFGATPSVLAMTAFAGAVAGSQKSSSVSLTHIIKGRVSAFRQTVGCFVQLRPLKLLLGEDENMGDIVMRARVARDQTSRLELPCRISLDQPAFQKRFLFNYAVEEPARQGDTLGSLFGLSVTRVGPPEPFQTHTSWAMQMQATESGNEVQGELIYSLDDFDHGTAGKVGQKMLTMLQALSEPASST